MMFGALDPAFSKELRKKMTSQNLLSQAAAIMRAQHKALNHARQVPTHRALNLGKYP